jgi:hypothetical protein
MKAIQNNNEETKTTNTQLRRSTMNATKLTMIVFAATAIVIGGCSSDNRITGPGNAVVPDIDKDLVENVSPAETENNAGRISLGSFDQKIERMDFEATVEKSNVEGGCWYLENVEFARYTPYFEENAPKLYIGLKLHVSGYIDENMSSYCMIGPVFHIEKYKILSRDGYAPAADIKIETAERAVARSAAADAVKETKLQAGFEYAPAEERAPKKKDTSGLSQEAAAEERAPKNDATSELSEAAAADAVSETKLQAGFEYAPAEERAPKKNETSGLSQEAAAEERAPKNDATSKLSEEAAADAVKETKLQDSFEYVPSEERAPKKKDTSGLSQEAVAEERAPKKNDATSKLSEAAAADADIYAPASIDARSQSALTVLKGYYGTNKEGCMYISDDKEIIAELHFTQGFCPNIQNGTLIVVKGEYSLLTWSPCQLAPLFNVDKFQILDGNDLVAKAGLEGK